MAIKNIIARGIGFSPGSVKFIITHGFISSEVVILIPTKALTAEDAGASLTAEDAGISLTAEDTGVSLLGETTEL